MNIAWQTDLALALPLLKEALDGLVALGGQSALDVLRSALLQAAADKAEWIEEAIQAIKQ